MVAFASTYARARALHGAYPAPRAGSARAHRQTQHRQEDGSSECLCADHHRHTGYMCHERVPSGMQGAPDAHGSIIDTQLLMVSGPSAHARRFPPAEGMQHTSPTHAIHQTREASEQQSQHSASVTAHPAQSHPSRYLDALPHLAHAHVLNW